MATEYNIMQYTSWGNYPKLKPGDNHFMQWRDERLPDDLAASYLPYGAGRSYGDSCLNSDGVLIHTAQLNHLLAFDKETGIIACEAGISLAELLAITIPAGWFLPVLPGTKYVTVGGAIANDIHGKNHHVAGTWGSHLLSFELLRSDNTLLTCSPQQNVDWYQATVGGLGLTGLILTARIQLKRIASTQMAVTTQRFYTLDEFFNLAALAEKTHEYTVAWLDCSATGKNFGRGLFIKANHVTLPPSSINTHSAAHRNVPFFLPNLMLNPWTIKLFNTCYFNAHAKYKEHIQHYEKFFFPLDSIHHWNRMYGRRGFLQYQFVLPQENAKTIHEVLQIITASGAGSFLSVLKTFGMQTSPGLLSFPMPGVTLALDFPNQGKKTLALLNRLDELVLKNQGRVYPAKDARMSASSFKQYYPQWQKFADYIDPRFSSSFWRRVTKGRN